MSGSGNAPGGRAALDWDAGEANERTLLAWQRSAIATLVLAALVIRSGIVYGPLWLASLLGVILVGSACAGWIFSRRRYLGYDGAEPPTGAIHARAIVAQAAVTVIAAAGVVWLAVGG
jgi:uncharacterized membrane protein YidH (DUF202 family)